MMDRIKLTTEYTMQGDQPKAVAGLVDGLEKGHRYQTLLGVTGSGKTFTASNVIERVQRRFRFALRIINIETDPELEKAYGEQIPVVFINGNKSFKYRVDEAELEKKVKRLWKT